MPRGRKKVTPQTIDEKMQAIDEKIEELKAQIKELRADKKELESEKEKAEISALYEAMKASGKTVEDVVKVIKK